MGEFGAVSVISGNIIGQTQVRRLATRAPRTSFCGAAGLFACLFVLPAPHALH
jgi:ABC-type sulfate transport system permease subunit